ncbi:MAG: hypothetical protein MUP11_06945, partial [Anaerolineales bacterium]|nr:hypothetical protein [Anaerolineales bacterium]
MPSIRKRTIGNEQYYYLEHSYREGGKVHKIEKYLGKSLPENIDELKEQLLSEVYQERWFDKFDHIQTNFHREAQNTPLNAQKKELETFAIRFTYDSNRIEGST